MDETEKKVRPILRWSKGKSDNWGFLCSLNGGDHFYGNLFLLLRKRKTLVHHTRNVGSIHLTYQLLVFR